MQKRRKIKQAWICQERETSKPWAVHVFCELQSGWGEPKITATVFHDDMFNGRDDSIWNVKVTSPGEFACLVSNVLGSYHIETNDDDIEQLVHWWLDLINLW